MTNGEKIQAILDIDTDCTEVYGKNGIMTFSVSQDWWDAEYKEPSSSEIPTCSDDCISKIETIDYLCKHCFDDGECFKDCDEIKHLRNMSSETSIRPKGHWINIDVTHSQCDKCSAVFEIASANGEANFCPNCGAKMVEPQEREEA